MSNDVKVKSRKYATLDIDRCKACGLCISNCPKDVLSITQQINKYGYNYVLIDKDNCIGCGRCFIVCPDGVFTIVEETEE